MPRVRKKAKTRSAALSAGWESLLLLHCGRVGVFMFLQGHPSWVRLMDDRQFRNEQILAIWTEHSDELLARWQREHPGVEPSVNAWLAKNR